jgi:4-hydroxy-tetrahydrodipicolinate reductase
MSMKIALIGYGKMGKAVESAAIKSNCQVFVASKSSLEPIDLDVLKSSDVAIEFTRPDAVVTNLLCCLESNIPVVTGTTGWNSEFENIHDLFTSKGGCLFSASNFSIGMNMVFELNALLSKWISKYDEYHPVIDEIHHLQKIDKPSGTALTLAADLIKNHNHYLTWKLHSEGEAIPEKNLPIHAHRKEGVVGTHEVSWKSPIDSISIKHEAYSREGFATGALAAAKWVIGKKGVFGMKDMLFSK